MSDRALALTYAAVEGRDWSAARRHAEEVLAAADRPAVQLLAVICSMQSDFAGALRWLEDARQAGDLSAADASRLIRLHLLTGDARVRWELWCDCCRNHVFGPPLYPLPRWTGEPLAGRHGVAELSSGPRAVVQDAEGRALGAGGQSHTVVANGARRSAALTRRLALGLPSDGN